MRIIKPFGRTHVDRTALGLRRRLALRGAPTARVEMSAFVENQDELILALWISTIDKIARKPQANGAPTPEQRAFRERLGAAAWVQLEASGRLPGLKDPERRLRLQRLWQVKIAPYGLREYRPRPGGTAPPPQGRWFGRFATPALNAAEADVAAIAMRIETHLHENELRLAPQRPPRRRGRVAAHAEAIASGVPRPIAPVPASRAWNESDWVAYFAAGDVAAEIRRVAERREAGGGQAGARRVGLDVAAEVLFAQYGRLFTAENGCTLSVTEAAATFPGLFALHAAIKATYSRLLKRHKKGLRLHGVARRAVSPLLPVTMEQLLVLVSAQARNQDLAGLLRLGKIIHYQASGGAPDRPENVIGSWPADVMQSPFWTSDGQTEIKQSEAFVRVWRRVLALATRTLTDWADDGTIGGDILMKAGMDKALGPAFDLERQRHKITFLLGKRAELFDTADPKEGGALLRFALTGLAELRHAAFHFKGLGGFAGALHGISAVGDPIILSKLRRFWDADAAARGEQLVAIARGAKFDCFFDAHAGPSLLEAVAKAHEAPLALPRLRKVLQRANNAWAAGEERLPLPEPLAGAAASDAAARARETALRLLYERPFRAWLHGRPANEVNHYIDRAVARATAAACALNARGDVDRAAVIVARAAALPRLEPGTSSDRFFHNLTAETATEMRVQRGYASDPDRAREQAAYIENLKLDVVALSFADFLDRAGFGFVLALCPGAIPTSAPLFALKPPADATPTSTPQDWQVSLYFLLHLAPVEDVDRLLHQVRRWRGGAGEESSSGPGRGVQAALELYVDMHDAKFDGGAVLADVTPFRRLYQRPDDFDRVFPATIDAVDDDRRLAKRGLREIVRFGHLPLLLPVFSRAPIAESEVDQMLAEEASGADSHSAIAGHQVERERLHALWVRQGRAFAPADRERYRAALGAVVRFRHLAGRVTLSDHLRLHRLLLAVWARLVDYSGLWERDLYFATLALIQRAGVAPQAALNAEGVRLLANGQIIAALQRGEPVAAVREGLEPHFTAVWKPGSRAVKIRNRIAHFNMLRGHEPVDLTYWVNQTRELLRHDRKLRNAVTQSIRELLHRENFELAWTTDGPSGHDMHRATLTTRQVFHLGSRSIAENLLGAAYVRMAASLFGDCEARLPTEDRPRPPGRRPDQLHRPLQRPNPPGADRPWRR